MFFGNFQQIFGGFYRSDKLRKHDLLSYKNWGSSLLFSKQIEIFLILCI